VIDEASQASHLGRVDDILVINAKQVAAADPQLLVHLLAQIRDLEREGGYINGWVSDETHLIKCTCRIWSFDLLRVFKAQDFQCIATPKNRVICKRASQCRLLAPETEKQTLDEVDR
jgi:hypothetical protein